MHCYVIIIFNHYYFFKKAFASSITGNICTHAILKGAGVGDENASVLAATITWLIKGHIYFSPCLSLSRYMYVCMCIYVLYLV